MLCGCGTSDPMAVDDYFICWNCGYEVVADPDASMCDSTCPTCDAVPGTNIDCPTCMSLVC